MNIQHQSAFIDTIPTEILDKIIDHIPPEDMPSISLVKRAWLPLGQGRAFKKVHLTTLARCIYFCSLTRRSPYLLGAVEEVRLEGDNVVGKVRATSKLLSQMTKVKTVWFSLARLVDPSGLDSIFPSLKTVIVHRSQVLEGFLPVFLAGRRCILNVIIYESFDINVSAPPHPTWPDRFSPASPSCSVAALRSDLSAPNALAALSRHIASPTTISISPTKLYEAAAIRYESLTECPMDVGRNADGELAR
ncbi:uncharacterized protein STEHIDRAFT_153302 [Stereum hirsutum FP-91666 SS1]|uniref:uncharacterized protein n=1 Tax=Stereum hirsutum (strain FP-91666) TaxID=721885 RepID=UPI000440C10A|nr:uncharacterized protein STEHIDRAFT_153302 [Stereum hirsutum FP-91666 SS1]EIM91681.1 hypothetical protein STEHIDRAFT_153302 [Stereum hirsutum FP-91666 SS1]